jgi:hypothetical protein
MSLDTISTLDNYFKLQYLQEGLQKVMPEYTPLMSGISFVGASEKAGSELVFPVLTSREHGFTALGQSGSQLSLRAATVAQSRQARVKSFGFMGRTQIDQLSISRATGSAQAFIDALQYKIENLQESFAVMNEVMLAYGQEGLGVVASGTEADGTYGGTTFTNGVSGTKLKIASKEFADHVWIGSEGMPVELYASNAIGAAVALSATIVSYDIENEWVELDTIGSLGGGAEGYVMYRAGFKDNEGAGLLRILKQTASSSALFEVASSNTPLWRVSQYNCGDQYLSFEQVAEGVSRAVGRGLADKLTLHVHPQTFASLMPDFNTLKQTGADFKSRMFTSAGDVKQLEHGMVGLTFYVGSVTLEVLANPFVRKGFAFGVADGELRRAGSTDITYDLPGEEKGRYFHRLPDVAAVELRCFADQTLFSKSLNKHILFSNIKVDAPSA